MAQIEREIASLTQEQKSNMGKIYKKYLTSLFSLVLVVTIAAACFFVYFSVQEAEAKRAYEISELQRENERKMNELQGKLVVQPLNLEPMEHYYDMKQIKFVPVLAGSVAILVGLLVISLVFKAKYPYFSEKKYKYLKKHNEI